MMKTITEYQPMIFSAMAAHTAQRTLHRQRLMINVSAIAGYCAVGISLFIDTGFAPWTWQYWTCIGPLIVAGEIPIHRLLPA